MIVVVIFLMNNDTQCQTKGGKMKRITLSIFLIWTVFISLTAQIGEISNISFERQIADFDYYNGSLHRYQDRLFAENYNKIEEYQVLANGDLERISFHLISRNSEPSAFIDQENLYYLETITEDLSYGSKVFLSKINISTSPMQYERTVPTDIYSCNNAVVYGDDIWLSDRDYQITRKFNKYTLESTGVINGLHDTYTIADSVIISVMSCYPAGKLRFYNINEIEGNTLPAYFKEIDLIDEDPVTIKSLKYKNGMLFVLGEGYIEIFDMTSANNPISKYKHAFFNEFGRDAYADAELVDNYLLTILESGRIFLHDMLNDIVYLVENEFIGCRGRCLSLDYPNFYVNKSLQLYQYKIDDFDSMTPIYRVKSYGISYRKAKYNGEYIVTYDESCQKLTLHSTFEGKRYTTYKDALYSIRDLKVSDNLLYVSYTPIEYGSNNIDIYEIADNELIFKNTILLNDPGYAIFAVGDYLYLQRSNSYYADVSVYQIIDYDLEFCYSFEGRMQNDTYYLDDYICFYNNGFIEFRDKTEPNIVVKYYEFEPSSPVNYLFIYLVNNNYIAIRDHYYKLYLYRIDEDELRLTDTYNFPVSTNISILNEVLTCHASNFKYKNLYYIGDGEFTKVGEFESSISSIDCYYPDKMLMISHNNSGSFMYRFDYELDTDDYTVHRPELVSVYPNPCATDNVKFKGEKLKNISIYNIKGQLVKEIQANSMNNNELTWNKKDKNMRNVASGIYFYKAVSEKGVQTGKVMVVK